jgi:hypothetical protein
MRLRRTPYFIGGEGQSEVSYAAWLRNHVRDRDLPFHLVLSDLGKGAGDPMTRIELAAERIARLESNQEQFAGRFLFLDTDQLAAGRNRAADAERRAREENIVVIWQVPTHEAFLLRHFPNCLTRRPPDKRAANLALGKVWPAYGKPCDVRHLEQQIAIEGAQRVASQHQEFAQLLRAIGLLNT